jgi:hypothetical protein
LSFQPLFSSPLFPQMTKLCRVYSLSAFGMIILAMM